jgi:hypothetical protein
MLQNHWHLGMYAREMQELRGREAAQERRLHEAGLPVGFLPGARLMASLGRAAARMWRRPPVTAATAAQSLPSAAASANASLAAAMPSLPLAVPRRLPRHADPYAGMAIIARSGTVLPAKEPCRIADC